MTDPHIKSNASEESKTAARCYFNPRIRGLEALLKQTSVESKTGGEGFLYYPTNGLNIVTYGAAGLGKTNLALQMAYAAATEEGLSPMKRQVIFFSKDTKSEVLIKRMAETFDFFGIKKQIPCFVLDVPLAECLYFFLSQMEIIKDKKFYTENKSSLEQIHFKCGMAAKIIEEKIRWIGWNSVDSWSSRPNFSSGKAPSESPSYSQNLETEIEDYATKIAFHLLSQPFFAFVDFDEVPTNLNKVDRYALTHSVYDCLSDLEPGLRPFFRKLKELTNVKEPSRETLPQLFIVCDSLSAATLEEHLRVQARYEHAHDGDQTKPIYLFIMENESMPKGMSVSFPPDVEIRLGLREEQHNIQTHTIQLVKTRFQPSLDEVAPFVIHSAQAKQPDTIDKEKSGKTQKQNADEPSVIKNQLPWIFKLYSKKDEQQQMSFWENPAENKLNEDDSGNFKKVFEVCPGIEIFPPLAHEEEDIRPNDPGYTIKFMIGKLDKCTDRHELDGGGCTLLVANNRCGATPLALHYLLGQVSQEPKLHWEINVLENEARIIKEEHEVKSKSINTADLKHQADATQMRNDAKLIQIETSLDEKRKLLKQNKKNRPKSVLYINFSDKFEDIVHTLFQYPDLRCGIKGIPKVYKIDWENFWEKSRQDINNRANSKGRHFGVLMRYQQNHYALPLEPKNNDGGHDHLHIFLPDFDWVTIEEAMHRVVRLLKGGHLGIERIVLDRVGRLKARWPLVKDSDVFISSLVSLCNKYRIDLLLIDDTAEENATTGQFHSQWSSLAQNIIRMRRIPFHGNEAIAIELVSAANRHIIQPRPYEVRETGDAKNFKAKMEVEDRFRGYLGFATGQLKRCNIEVDLSYDAENTPLHAEILSMQKNLEAAMDGVKVKLLARGDWSGINSAFANLADVSRDTSHIVAIDGVWLKTMLEKNILHKLKNEELGEVIPKMNQEGFAKCLDSENRNSGSIQDESDQISKYIDHIYVTKSTTVAEASLRENNKDFVGKKIDGTHCAIPMRHNWGVLAITRFSNKKNNPFRQMFFNFKHGLPKASKSNSTKETHPKRRKGWARFELGDIGNELLFGFESFNFDMHKDKKATELSSPLATSRKKILKDKPHYINKIFSYVNGKQADSQALCWADIADFRTDYWFDWKNHTRKILDDHRVRNKEIEYEHIWLRLLPEIDAFSIAQTSEESVVSFLLELLLAELEWKELIDTSNPKKTGELIFNVSDGSKNSFVDVLLLFYRLFSPEQRRQLGIGLRGKPYSDIGVNLMDRFSGRVDDGMPENIFSAWPKQISLFAREWITTVPDLMPRYDIRESIHIRPLPSGKAIQSDVKKSYWAEVVDSNGETIASYNGINNYGPTVAGTWYLGILKGGNTDLGTDVMKVILSEELEKQRLFNRCGAPVSTKLYSENYIDTKTEKAESNNPPSLKAHVSSSHSLPYADVMQAVYCSKTSYSEKTNMGHIYFPFHRTQIKNYLEISPILYDLVRHVMRIEIDDERNLRSDNKPKQEEIKAQIGILVSLAFSRMKETWGQHNCKRAI